jgi:ATP-dependent DNA helicase RecG
VLLTDAPAAGERLRAFARETDGFAIAELDLRERGAGELAGVRQSGGVTLRYTRLEDDADLVRAAQREARALLERDPALRRPEHAGLRRRIERRYERGVELFRVG